MRWTLEDGMMVRRFGAGPEIVWIHGLGEWSPLFDPIANHPAFAGFSHVLPDLPGYGRSPWPVHPEDLDPLADRLIAWLGAWLGDARPILIGHSMGGVLAILIAERLAVTAVVNIDGNLSSGDCTFSAQAAAYSREEFLDYGFSALRADVYERGRTDVPLRGYHAAMCAASPEVYHHHAGQLIAVSDPETLAPRMAGLHAPGLFVAGVPDGVCARSRELLDRHGVRWVGLEPAGHWPHWDQPDRFASIVSDFLREL
ncbi:MAG TPA: alpha/beta hydrolase [Kofleriaceae bacterium]|nr:alpha/beta hydrolase [Kofleriaceae bacterium]